MNLARLPFYSAIPVVIQIRNVLRRAHVLSILLILTAAFKTQADSPKFTDVPGFGTNTTKAATNIPKGTNAVVKSATTNALSALDENYKLCIGDHLSFRIVEDDEGVKPLVVADSGELEIPYLGRFPATGKTCKELAAALKNELEKEYYYTATVIVAVDTMTIKSRGRIYLVGAVRSPGPQEIPNDEVLTLSKAILRAGGFTDYAEKRKVKVTRKGDQEGAPEKVFTINVEEVLEKGKFDSDLALQSGDLIYVNERLVRL